LTTAFLAIPKRKLHERCRQVKKALNTRCAPHTCISLVFLSSFLSFLGTEVCFAFSFLSLLHSFIVTSCGERSDRSEKAFRGCVAPLPSRRHAVSIFLLPFVCINIFIPFFRCTFPPFCLLLCHHNAVGSCRLSTVTSSASSVLFVL